MVIMIGRLIWKCVIPEMIVGNVLLRGLDLIMTIKKEVKKKLRQDMMREKLRKLVNRQQNEDIHDKGCVEYMGAGNPNLAKRCRS